MEHGMGLLMGDLYIWINRWEEFQTYTLRRGKPWAPPWIKTWPRQLGDDAYLDLNDGERLLLRELRESFATERGQLRLDPVRLSQRFGRKVLRRQLERLNRAGFITFCSETVREQRWNGFVNSSATCSSPEVEVEVEVKTLKALAVVVVAAGETVDNSHEPERDPNDTGPDEPDFELEESNGNGPGIEEDEDDGRTALDKLRTEAKNP
jgi:hypothetical protein